MASRQLANSLRDVLGYRGVPLLAAALVPHMDAIGYLSIFFALQPEKLRIPPLSEAAALAFTGAEIARAGVDCDEPGELAREIVHLAKSAPGSIRAMVNMARQPRYRRRNQVKVHLIYLDLLTGTPPTR